MLEQIYGFNKDGDTPFAPSWEYYIGEGQVEFDLYLIQKEVMSKEEEIIDKYEFVSDWGTKLGKDSLTSRSGNYNLLEFDNAKPLRKVIRKVHDQFIESLEYPPLDEIYVQSWANVMRKNQKIFPHIHNPTPACYLSGHVCVQVNQTSTYYVNPFTEENWESKNFDGKITIFPSWMKHYTDSVKDNKIRMTFAFDIIRKEEWTEHVANQNHWVKL
tara:strand:- start:1975 stop:2619 length:645 start_codon:yes stop_codon:yes gene_type:complete